MATLPKAHLMRSPLPWRVEQATECGQLANKVSIVAREEFEKMDRRASCSICRSVFKRLGPDALLFQVQEAIGRGLSSYRVLKGQAKGGGVREYRRRVDDPIVFELQALADLAARHRKEFEALVAAAESERTVQGGG
jgi:hypothetical protein